MQHKDPRIETAAPEPSEDPADTSPHEFYKAANFQSGKITLEL